MQFQGCIDGAGVVLHGQHRNGPLGHLDRDHRVVGAGALQVPRALSWHYRRIDETVAAASQM